MFQNGSSGWTIICEYHGEEGKCVAGNAFLLDRDDTSGNEVPGRLYSLSDLDVYGKRQPVSTSSRRCVAKFKGRHCDDMKANVPGSPPRHDTAELVLQETRLTSKKRDLSLSESAAINPRKNSVSAACSETICRVLAKIFLPR